MANINLNFQGEELTSDSTVQKIISAVPGFEDNNSKNMVVFIEVFSGNLAFKVQPKSETAPATGTLSYVYSSPAKIAPIELNFLTQDLYIEGSGATFNITFG